MIVLLAFSFLGLIHLVRSTSKTESGASIFLTAATIISILYVAGFTPFLRESAYAVFVLGLGLTVGFAYSDFQRRTRLFRHTVLSLPVGVFTAFLLFTYVSFQNSWFLHWDEISHWGLVLKEMLLYDRNLQQGDLSYLTIYPPGAATFQYFFSVLLGTREGNAYCAQATLMLAPLLQLLDLKSPQRFSGRFVFLFGFLLVFVFFYGWKMIYVDGAVSLFFAGGLMFYTINRPFTPGRLLWMIPLLVSIGLIKYIGSLLVTITIIAILLDTLFEGRRPLREGALFAGAFTLLYGIPKFSLLLWANRSIETILNPVVYTPRQPISIANVVSVLTGDGLAPYQKEIVMKFTDALGNLNIVQQPPDFTAGVRFVFIQIGVLAVMAAFNARKERWTIITMQLVLGIGFALYAFGLLVLYIFRFDEFEGTNLASFGRYMSIYLNAWLILTLLQCMMTFKKLTGVLFGIIALLFISQFLSRKQFDQAFIHNSPPAGVRESLQAALQPVIRDVPKDKKIYLVWQKTTGFELYVTRFEVAPRETNMACWSLGPPWSKEDIWTCNKSVDEFKVALQGFDYLFLGHTDVDFWDKYAAIFPKDIDRSKYLFYKISKTPELLLTPLD